MKKETSVESAEMQVNCGECGEHYKLSSELSSLLQEGHPITCTSCGKTVEVDKRKTTRFNFWHTCIVVYITLGFLTMAIISLYNLLSDNNFSLLFISVPFLLSIVLIKKIHSSMPLPLVAASSDTNESTLETGNSHPQ